MDYLVEGVGVPVKTNCPTVAEKPARNALNGYIHGRKPVSAHRSPSMGSRL